MLELLISTTNWQKHTVLISLKEPIMGLPFGYNEDQQDEFKVFSIDESGVES